VRYRTLCVCALCVTALCVCALCAAAHGRTCATAQTAGMQHACRRMCVTAHRRCAGARYAHARTKARRPKASRLSCGRSRLCQGLRSRRRSDVTHCRREGVAGFCHAIHAPEQVGAAHEGLDAPRLPVVPDVLKNPPGGILELAGTLRRDLGIGAHSAFTETAPARILTSTRSPSMTLSATPSSRSLAFAFSALNERTSCSSATVTR